MNNLMIIAHPDDDAVFACQFQKAFYADWHIIVCSADNERKREIFSYQQALKNKGITNSFNINFLDFEDNPNDFNKKISSWDTNLVREKIINQIKSFDRYDMILFHNKIGEYNHPHHITVYDAAYQIKHRNKFLFGYGLPHPDLILSSNFDINIIIDNYKSQSWVVDSFNVQTQTFVKR